MSRGADGWIRWTTTGCVALLALIAGTVSYLHMHLLVELHGQPGWVAALTPRTPASSSIHPTENCSSQMACRCRSASGS